MGLIDTPLSTGTRKHCINTAKNVTTRCDFRAWNASKCVCDRRRPHQGTYSTLPTP